MPALRGCCWLAGVHHLTAPHCTARDSSAAQAAAAGIHSRLCHAAAVKRTRPTVRTHAAGALMAPPCKRLRQATSTLPSAACPSEPPHLQAEQPGQARPGQGAGFALLCLSCIGRAQTTYWASRHVAQCQVSSLTAQAACIPRQARPGQAGPGADCPAAAMIMIMRLVLAHVRACKQACQGGGGEVGAGGEGRGPPHVQHSAIV